MESRNIIDPEIAERNRSGDNPGGYTFNAFPPDDYEGAVIVVICIRLGDHAHLELRRGRALAGATSRLIGVSHAGYLIFAWSDWLLFREILDADPRVRIAEVEQPTLGQLQTHLPSVQNP